MKLIIFDMDGTLIDSQHDITESVNFVRKEHYGLEKLTCKYVVEAINREKRNLPKLFYNTEIYEDSAKEIFEKHYHEQCIKNPRLYEGISETLEALKEQGFNMSVATNAPSTFATRMLSHLNIAEYFDYIVGADLVEKPKPYVDMFEYLSDKYNVNINKYESYMIGDNSKDMGFAKNSGIKGIFATWGFSKEGEGDFTASHPEEILHILSK